jgi:hypothetical protein
VARSAGTALPSPGSADRDQRCRVYVATILVLSWC